MRDINIAIDGPAASGKGTVAKTVARLLNFRYVDTGAMYRAVAYLASIQGLAFNDEAALTSMVAEMAFEFTWNGENLLLSVNGTDVSTAIRSEDIGAGASRVSRFPGVRKALLGQQQELATSGGVVMDGRDVGTVILPDAELKVFLEASLDVRATRRHIEMLDRGHTASLDEIRQQLADRDHQDATRATAPLRRAHNAVLIDSSDLSIEDVVRRVVELAKTCQSQ